MTQSASQIHPIGEIKINRVVCRIGREAQRRLFLGVLVLSDTLMLAFAFALAYWARFNVGLPIFDLGVVPEGAFYVRIASVLVVVWLALFVAFRAYDWDNLLGGIQEYAQIANAATVATVLVITVGFIGQNLVIARGWLLCAWLLSMLCPSVSRFAIRRVAYRLRRYGYLVTPTLIVGVNDEAVALAQQLSAMTSSGLQVLGFIGESERVGQRLLSQMYVVGDLNGLPELIERYSIEEVIVASSAISPTQLLELFRQYGNHERVNLRLSSGLFDIINTGISVKILGYVPLIRINKVRLSDAEAFMKACLDRIGSLVAIITLAPLLGAIALAVKLDSPGPIIYRRRVLGQGGAEFDAYKFRTMKVDGDDLLNVEQRADLQTNYKLKDDPRITEVGQILRKYSLDELPQLFNVLRGQMSLVGPRMITPEEKNKYGKWDMNLLTVKPGLSGLWQVSGRSDVSYDERVRLDMQYIRTYTIWLDLQILVRTFLVVVKGRGAY